MTNDAEGSAFLLGLSIDDLFKEAYKAIEKKDMDKLGDIGILVKRYFCKKIAQFQIEELALFNKLLVKFLSWFEWGGEPKWKEAVPIIEKWDTILEISQIIYDTDSPRKAYRELKKSPYGQTLAAMLYDRKMMKPEEIRNALNIETMQQVSDLLYNFEKAGIIVREVMGNEIWVSLAMQGMELYCEFIRSDESYLMQLIIGALRDLDRMELDKASEKLKIARGKEPIAICLLGIVALENGKLEEAGKLFTESVDLGIEQGKIFFIFYILEKMGRLEKLRDGIMMLNFQREDISAKIKPTLRILGMLYEYLGNTPRAKDYYRLAET